MQKLVSYEQGKVKQHQDQHQAMLEKVKIAQLEKKMAEQKLLKLAEL